MTTGKFQEKKFCASSFEAGELICLTALNSFIKTLQKIFSKKYNSNNNKPEKNNSKLGVKKKKDTTKHHLTIKQKTKNKGSGRGGVLYHTLVGIRKLSIGLRSLTLS